MRLRRVLRWWRGILGMVIREWVALRMAPFIVMIVMICFLAIFLAFPSMPRIMGRPQDRLLGVFSKELWLLVVKDLSVFGSAILAAWQQISRVRWASLDTAATFREANYIASSSGYVLKPGLNDLLMLVVYITGEYAKCQNETEIEFVAWVCIWKGPLYWLWRRRSGDCIVKKTSWRNCTWQLGFWLLVGWVSPLGLSRGPVADLNDRILNAWARAGGIGGFIISAECVKFANAAE